MRGTLKELINQIEKFLMEVNKEHKVKFAYLFGSQARGEANENSDIYDNAMLENIKNGEYFGV